MTSDINITGTRPGIAGYLAPVIICVALMFLAGCQTLPEEPSTAPQPSRVRPLGAAVEKTVRYEILSDLSDIRFLVYRGGPLAKLGHNHVVQAKNIKGEIHVAPDVQQSSFSIELPVKNFKVDDDTARSEEGDEFSPQPDGEAIAGTTRNMLGEKVLDAEKYPTIEIRSAGLSGPSWGMDILVRIRMHGVEREVVVPTVIEKGSNKLVATAFFSINQTDYGITPMSVMGGGLKVQDAIKVRMRIVAQMR